MQPPAAADDESPPPSFRYLPPPEAPAGHVRSPARAFLEMGEQVSDANRTSRMTDYRRPDQGRALRVAMVAPLYAPHIGGVEQHVSSLAGELSRLGHRVVVLTQEPDRGLLKDGPQPAGLRVIRFRSVVPTDRYPVAPGLWQWLRRHACEFDVAHLHGYHGAASLSGLLSGHALPIIFTPHFHGEGHTGFARALHVFHRPLGRALVRRARAIIAVSRAEAELLGAHFPRSAERTRVIPNGVRLLGSRSESLSPAGRPPVLVSVSRLEAYKRVDRIVEVLAALPEEWSLRLIGRGSQGDILRSLAARLGVGSRVRFDADLSDEQLASVYQSAGVYISLSEREAFGMSLLEAAACGLPAIASDIAAHRELAGLAPGSLRLVDGSRAGDVARSVLEVAAAAVDTSWLPSLSWPSVASATVEVYSEVLGG